MLIGFTALLSTASVFAEEGMIRPVAVPTAIVSASVFTPQLGRHGLADLTLHSSRSLCPAQTDQLCFPDKLQNLYASHEFMPVWLDESLVEEFFLQLSALAESDRVPGMMQRLQELKQLRADRDSRGFDLLASDTYLVYQAVIAKMERDPSSLYRSAVFQLTAQDQLSIPAFSLPVSMAQLQQLRPVEENFQRLVAQMNVLEQQAPHGVHLSGRPAIEFGDPIPRGEKLAKMLNVYGDLSDQDYTNLASAQPEDAAAGIIRIGDPYANRGVLHEAIRRFQQRHGLQDDGIIGPATARNLTRSYQQVAQLLALNMQRSRALQRHYPGEVLQVNIPEFMLRILDEDKVVFESKVIVGRSQRPTYLFSSAINHMVVNPTWNVPETIKEEDVIPSLKRSPDYLAQHNMRMVSRWSDAGSIDPSQIDWSTVSASNFPYEFQQRPGPSNALGQVKFMMPNDYSIYLHDTPAKRLFNRSKRDFSSGCVRVERAHDLANYLLERQRAGQSASYQNLLRKRTTATINLRKTLAVDFIYRTAWLDDQGRLQIREDIYGYDDESSVPAEHDYIAMNRYR
ncbi:L,D-transpeptidase family protein [Photobacterium sp. GJ3]|uniref:L,D-transpeptidase family protein n=1 Tax=Photobacterium sp. GJ3 TaxID=2829502 RepID=UPI001B8AB770|nr:L,D-transpeptidase family protein [Photobacterium sp. GJ3]QUJ68902.1 L,D-transpeptidase family protein [Photobacterium sp. GJ3]